MTPASTAFPEARARELLFVRALEEADGGGVLLSTVERERAGGRVGEAGPEGLVRRAEELLGLARERAGGVDGILAMAGGDVGGLWVAAGALAVGLATNVLGAGGVVNVLAFPLLGALVWNLGVYAALAVAALRSGGSGHAGAGASSRLALALAGGRLRRAWRGLTRLGVSSERAERASVASEAAGRFSALWLDAAGPLLAARLKRTLHLGAVALVLGMVGGMYLRGLAFEYRAQWGSTFLGADAVDALFAVLFAPARALSGLELPAASTLRTPATGDAAPWIHAWALTAGLVVAAPRLALWGLERARVARLAAAVPVDLSAPYWRRLLAAGTGGGVRARIVPYSCTVAPRGADRLRTLLHDLLGTRAEVELAAPLAYGADPGDVGGAAGAGSDVCLVPVFALAQPPEVEVHGRFLDELAAAAPDGARVLAVVDAAGFAERIGDPERLAERRRAWDRVLREVRRSGLHVDLSAPPSDDELARAEAALAVSGRAAGGAR